MVTGDNDIRQKWAELAIARLKLGEFHVNRGNYAEAEELYRNFLVSPIAASMPKEMEATVKSKLAFALLIQKKFTDAEQYYREAISLLEQVGDERGVVVLRTSLAYLLKQHERYVEAVDEYRGNCLSYERLGDIRELGLTLSSLADVLCKVNEYKDAKVCYQRSIEIAKSLGARSEASETQRKLDSLPHDH